MTGKQEFGSGNAECGKKKKRAGKQEFGSGNYLNSEGGMRNAEVEGAAAVNEDRKKIAGFGFEKCGSGF